MKYLSDDGKVFNTERECLRHEENERIRKEKLEMERQDKQKEIHKTYEKLLKLFYEYGQEYNIKREIYFVPAYELLEAL